MSGPNDPPYADEILFQAGVHPRTRMSIVADNEASDLYHQLKDVLQTAIDCWARPDQFPDSVIAPRRQEGGRCPRCGTELRRLKVSSRSAYYCPECQKKRGAQDRAAGGGKQ